MSSFAPDTIDCPSGSFIAGRFVRGGGDELPVERPSDGAVLGIFREASEADVDEAVRCAAETRRAERWGSGDPRRRGAVLRRWAELVERDREYLARLEALCSSRPVTEARQRDIPVVAELLRYYGECADKCPGEVLATSHDALNMVEHEAWGVVLAISPWNVPALLAAAKVAPALAAGNAVILKPSELTPLSMLRIAELGVEAGLPRGLFSVLVGRGPTTGRAAVRHPLVGYVSFTGSTATGAAIMSDAAHHGMKPVSMELGGKSPQVVFADAPDLEKVADLVALGVSRNAGQICFAGTRLIVEEAVAERFVGKVVERLRGVRPGPTWREETDLPPIISKRQADRIEALVESGRAGGAKVVAGGERFVLDGGQYFAPTVMAELGSDNPALREEIFGPVLGVQTFRGFDEAMRLADHPVYGLTASLYTRDIDKAIHGARAIEAGTIWINGYGRGADLGSPFGGFKQSGFGKDFGIDGFKKYRRSKSINVFLTEAEREAA
ncbi:aldehyde dehydrogenase family protein [Propylenella binzhouense]|uniref:Aldehyde dehydrogenase n=1 Tax=Propylenella binzhouense TaxID=2555902 RepID=A0A964T120_9HYPH|nr:aldehyde dehydrogenase family protein [Propylenella binzhouense]MYZ46350.1 aldehyde dehydrogenase [Propylenella binzhouense]